MKPIGKYIAIKEIKEEVKTKSGLLLSGDDVDGIRYYDSRAGYSMFIENEQFTIIQEHDVVVVV